MFEARFWEKEKGDWVRCLLCPHKCVIREGGRGRCGTRENRGGILYSLSYGGVVSAAVDPIEKKPLYHFLPGTDIFSFCTPGCNLGCEFCQNADISQMGKASPEENGRAKVRVEPEEIVLLCQKQKCLSIAYTYTEPTVFWEFAYDVCRFAHKQKIRNVFVTNGFICPEPLQQIAEFLDGVNVDLKAMNRDFYHKVCKADLPPVLDCIKTLHALGVWIEITTLLIPGFNDSEKEIEGVAGWIAGLDPGIPWHISAFSPAFKMQQVPSTPAATLSQAAEIGRRQGLQYIYLGNIASGEYQDTHCPQCKHLLIKRRYYSVNSYLEAGRCPDCNYQVPGRW